MSSVCIVTDSAAQFPQLSFNSRNLLTIVPLASQLNGRAYTSIDEFKPANLPASADDALSPHLVAPNQEQFLALFSDLAKSYHAILGIFTSSSLASIFNNAQEAANVLRGGVEIQVIDSQTIAAGLGFLVETAANAALQGIPGQEIEYEVRSLIPHIYGVLCIPRLSYLYYNQFIDRGQATIAEMLGLYSIYAIEEGKLSPLEKLRNHRHTVNYFQEFLDEFDNLQHISLLQSLPPNQQEAQALREHAREVFPKTSFTTHSTNLALATLFGPRSMGLFAIEAIE